MKNMLASIIKNKIVACIVLLALGVLLVITPLDTLARSVRLVGAVLLAGAAIGLLIFFLSKKEDRSPLVLAESVVAAIIAVLCLIIPGLITGVLPYIFGVILLLNALLELITALRLPRGKLFAVLLSMLAVVCAVVILCNPAALANFITRLIGLTLIYSGIIGVIALALSIGKNKEPKI